MTSQSQSAAKAQPLTKEQRWDMLHERAERAATVKGVYGEGAVRGGGIWLVRCPFHETQLSGAKLVTVDPDTLRWRCEEPSCGRAGSVLAWLNGGREPHGIGYKRCVVKLADLAKVPVPAKARAAAEGNYEQRKAAALEAASLPIRKGLPDEQIHVAKPSSVDVARRIWAEASTVPRDQMHPVRRWVAREGAYRGCWPVDREFPLSVRWQVQVGGGGAIVAAAAPLDGWCEAYPYVPDVRGVLLMPIDANGQATGDVRSYGDLHGCGALVGGLPGRGGRDPSAPLYVVERLPDALGVATWFNGGYEVDQAVGWHGKRLRLA